MATDNVCKVELIPSLRINGNDFTTPASNQEDPIQTLHEDFEELHIWRNSQDEEHFPLSGNNTSKSMLKVTRFNLYTYFLQ